MGGPQFSFTPLTVLAGRFAFAPDPRLCRGQFFEVLVYFLRRLLWVVHSMPIVVYDVHSAPGVQGRCRYKCSTAPQELADKMWRDKFQR